MKEIDPLPAFGSTNSLNCRAEGHLNPDAPGSENDLQCCCSQTFGSWMRKRSSFIASAWTAQCWIPCLM